MEEMGICDLVIDKTFPFLCHQTVMFLSLPQRLYPHEKNSFQKVKLSLGGVEIGGCRNHGPTVPFNRPGLLNGIRFFPDSEFPD